MGALFRALAKAEDPLGFPGTGLNPVCEEARGSQGQDGVVQGFMDRDPLQRDGTVFGPSSDEGMDWTPRSLVLECGAKEVGRAGTFRAA